MTSGACVSNPAQRSPIIMCLEGRHGLHRQPVLDQHPEGCALAARARRHVDDMTISNRVRLAAHHDDFVHLTPVHLPEETMEALVVGERRVARCSCCMRGSLDRTWLAVDRGDKTRNWTTESPFLTLNPERFTVKKERFTSPAIRHCFLSGFDHRACPITLIRFEEGAVATFRSLHPCAFFNQGTKFPPVQARGGFQGMRLEHPTPVPRRHALGARGGIPGDADALSRERGTAQLPSVPPACGICPQVQAGGVRAEEASCLPRAGE